MRQKDRQLKPMLKLKDKRLLVNRLKRKQLKRRLPEKLLKRKLQLLLLKQMLSDNNWLIDWLSSKECWL